MTRAADSSSAIAETYTELRGTLLGYLQRKVFDRQVAEDLLQDVVLKALTLESKGASPPDNLAAWLHTVARNAAIDYLRTRHPSTELPDDLAAHESDASFTGTLSQCLRPFAERLPVPYRDTVLAAEFDQTPLALIAEREGVSLSAIKSRASRGRRLLHEKLVRCCNAVVTDQGLDFDERKASGCAEARCRRS